MIAKITNAYTITYSDNGQIMSYIEWLDHNGKAGRTEGHPKNGHMSSLLARAKREGINHTIQTW